MTSKLVGRAGLQPLQLFALTGDPTAGVVCASGVHGAPFRRTAHRPWPTARLCTKSEVLRICRQEMPPIDDSLRISRCSVVQVTLQRKLSVGRFLSNHHVCGLVACITLSGLTVPS